jgi:hypothetical protein
MMADGTPLTIASGINTNELMQPYVMPAPIVVNASKIPDTNLPTTYLYDIPTTAGQEILLVADRTSTGITMATYKEDRDNDSLPVYTVDGRIADTSYRGIAIINGKKIVKR